MKILYFIFYPFQVYRICLERNEKNFIFHSLWIFISTITEIQGRFFVPVRGIIVILSKLTANKKREGAEGRFSEEITCRFLAGGSLMKFKKHLSFVACAEQARRNLENKHRRGARDAISPGPSSWIFKLNIKPVAKSPSNFECDRSPRSSKNSRIKLVSIRTSISSLSKTFEYLIRRNFRTRPWNQRVVKFREFS